MVVENDDLPMRLELGSGMVVPIDKFRFAGWKTFEDAYRESIIDIYKGRLIRFNFRRGKCRSDIRTNVTHLSSTAI